MPEGHTLHRLAAALRDRFAGRPVEVSSPQGRFAESAAVLDGGVVEGAEAWGKHLFVAFEVMLAASYVLITLEADENRTRAGMTYTIVSLTSSLLFGVGSLDPLTYVAAALLLALVAACASYLPARRAAASR